MCFYMCATSKHTGVLFLARLQRIGLFRERNGTKEVASRNG